MISSGLRPVSNQFVFTWFRGPTSDRSESFVSVQQPEWEKPASDDFFGAGFMLTERAFVWRPIWSRTGLMKSGPWLCTLPSLPSVRCTIVQDGFNIWPTFVQQKLNGCCTQKTKSCASKRTNNFAKFDREELRTRNQTTCRHIHLATVCSTIVEQSVQTPSTPFNIYENKRKVESMLNESLNQFKPYSTRFQQAFRIFYAFNNVGWPVQTHPTFGTTKCWTHGEPNVETLNKLELQSLSKI